MEVLHLDYRPPTAGWVLPLQSRLQGSSSHTLRQRYSKWSEVGLDELGMAATTRLTVAFVVARRLASLLQNLRDEIAASGRLEDLLDGGLAYTPKDPWICYEICGAVDAVFFEYRSCYEVLGSFAACFGKHILQRPVSEAASIDMLARAGADTTWIAPLRLHRILFFHNTAPWLALKVDRRDPLQCSLLVMKKNLHTFDNPDEYIVQPAIADTIAGFQIASWRLRDWLAAQIDEVETELVGTHRGSAI